MLVSRGRCACTLNLRSWSIIHKWIRIQTAVSRSLLGHVDPSLRALSGRLKMTVRRHKFIHDSFSRR